MPAAGDDYIEGLGGDDEIVGGNGDDQIVGGTGADTLEAEPASTRFPTTARRPRVVVNLTTNSAHYGDAQGDVISGFEKLVGSNFNDILTGSNVANVISGDGGNDMINGGAGADTINGDAARIR